MDVDAVIGPLSFSATLREMSRRSADVVAQLGGDLLFGRFLSRRHGARFLCYAYGPKSGMKWCDIVATAFPHMAEKLRKRHRSVFLTGDLVRDAVGMRDAAERMDPAKRDAAMRIIVFPGSRKGIRDASFPFVKDVFRGVRKEFPDIAVRALLFPFAEREEYAHWKDAGLEPTDASSAEAMEWADLAVTQPGTNTLELMHRRVPFLVVAPFSFIPHIPVSGIVNVLRRLPGGERLVKWSLLRKKRAASFLSWPNRIAGREVVREMIGDITPEDVADALRSLIREPERRNAIRSELARLSALGGDRASEALADCIERLMEER
jgi:lipid-A-disaccharide synthase